MEANVWANTLITSFQNMWDRLIGFIPQFLSAVIVLIIGLLVAAALGRLVKSLVAMTRVDELIKRSGMPQKMEGSEVTLTLSGVLGWLVKWFLIIVVLMAVAEILNWTQIISFLNDVALYIPNVLIAVVILAVGVIVGQFIYKVVEEAITVSRTPSSAARPIAAVSKWAIVIFSLMAALIQLGVANSLIEILFSGLVAMLAIAGGLAFGLGGKEKAAKWLDAIEHEVSRR